MYSCTFILYKCMYIRPPIILTCTLITLINYLQSATNSKYLWCNLLLYIPLDSYIRNLGYKTSSADIAFGTLNCSVHILMNILYYNVITSYYFFIYIYISSLLLIYLSLLCICVFQQKFGRLVYKLLLYNF